MDTNMEDSNDSGPSGPNQEDSNSFALVSIGAPQQDEDSQPILSDSAMDELVGNGDDEYRVKLDSLGPIVLNADGTMGRVSNWAEMSETEKAQAIRLISARNKRRKKELMEHKSLLEKNTD